WSSPAVCVAMPKPTREGPDGPRWTRSGSRTSNAGIEPCGSSSRSARWWKINFAFARSEAPRRCRAAWAPLRPTPAPPRSRCGPRWGRSAVEPSRSPNGSLDAIADPFDGEERGVGDAQQRVVEQDRHDHQDAEVEAPRERAPDHADPPAEERHRSTELDEKRQAGQRREDPVVADREGADDGVAGAELGLAKV